MVYSHYWWAVELFPVRGCCAQVFGDMYFHFYSEALPQPEQVLIM